MSFDEQSGKTVTVGAVEVLKHSEKPCRHCGNMFEQAGKSCCSRPGSRFCPVCGHPTSDPIVSIAEKDAVQR